MDRDEALWLLKGGEEGIEEWNRRREAEEDRLSEALLRGPDLREADLRGADLFGAGL